jgi:hypothetical protein
VAVGKSRETCTVLCDDVLVMLVSIAVELDTEVGAEVDTESSVEVDDGVVAMLL